MSDENVQLSACQQDDWEKFSRFIDGKISEDEWLGPPQTLDDMVERWRRSSDDQVNSRLTSGYLYVHASRFSAEDVRCWEISSSRTTGEVLQCISGQKGRPATLEQLLAFGAKYPDNWRLARHVALGTDLGDETGDTTGYPVDGLPGIETRCIAVQWMSPQDKWPAGTRFLFSSTRTIGD